jgi:UDP-N-acetylglucosamine transferase subunit ALG13
LWVTFSSRQSRALLASRPTEYVRNTPPRDWRSILINTKNARRILNSSVDSVVSSGAGIALSFLPLARARGIDTHYIECSARVTGPSVSGRILETVPGVRLYTQYPDQTSERWSYRGSVFDDYDTMPVSAPQELRSVFVTVGTLNFSFMRLLERLRRVLPASVQVTVQAGVDTGQLVWPGATIKELLDANELSAAMEAADVVVAHAGIGSALSALRVGKVPILVPRMSSCNEHVDDHQLQITSHLSALGLAVITDADTLGPVHFAEALTRRAVRPVGERLFELS